MPAQFVIRRGTKLHTLEMVDVARDVRAPLN